MELITKQQAIDALGKKPLAWEQGEYEEGLQTQWESDIEAIKALPPAEPKRETTTLRIGRTRNSVTMWYECAECGEPVDQEDAFCRRCGRRLIHG